MRLRIGKLSDTRSGAGFRDAPTSKGGRVVGFLFGVPFFAMGAAFCWFMAISPILKSISSGDWPQVPCTITQSFVDSHSSSDGTTYSVEIEFRYAFGTRAFEGGSYDFNSVNSSGRSGKQKVVARYPVGSQHLCWVNPKDPSEAVLSRSIPKMVYFTVAFTSVFMVVGLAIMLGSLGLLPRKWKDRVVSRHKPVESENRGEAELKPQVGGLGKCLGMLAICLFWNGIVGVFVWQIIEGFKKDRTEWFLVFFMIPFVLVGIGFVCGVVYYLLALRNPTFTLRLSEGKPRLGQTVSLSWSSTGSLRRLQSLKILLEGKEAATYRRGTRSVTDRCTFHRSIVFETDQPESHRTGEIELSIPAELMHSFQGGNNLIEWRLRIEGPIHRWPDVSTDYPLTVRAREETANRIY